MLPWLSKPTVFVFDPQYMFLREETTTRPLLYLQAGDQRSSTGDDVEHAFSLEVGGGMQVKLSEHFAVQLTPAEYSFVQAASGSTHSFSAKVGISRPLWKKAKA
jgi:hypothetical protein